MSKYVLIILIFIIIIIVIWIISSYNNLVKIKHELEKYWNKIDQDLNYQADLINKLSYLVNNKKLITSIKKETIKFNNAKFKLDELKYFKYLESDLNNIESIIKGDISLKENSDIKDILNEIEKLNLSLTTNKKFYNNMVSKYQTKMEMFPSNLIAALFNFDSDLYSFID